MRQALHKFSVTVNGLRKNYDNNVARRTQRAHINLNHVEFRCLQLSLQILLLFYGIDLASTARFEIFSTTVKLVN